MKKKWNDGIEILNAGNKPIGDLQIDAFEDGGGFSLIFANGVDQFSELSTIEALGFDMDGNQTWSTTMNIVLKARSICENSTGFHEGQNIVVWTDATNGGIYGQNITPKGVMGPIIEECPGPENFQGEYQFDMDSQDFGVLLSWDNPTDPVEYYRVYRTDAYSGEETVIEFEGTLPYYYDPCGIGTYEYQLRALYADTDCGYSLPATTPTGDDYFRIEVTSVQESASEPIVTVLNIYTMNGQLIRNANRETLSKGLYIIQGFTKDGQLVTQKTCVE